MGGAQPRAATMAGARLLAVECDPDRIAFRMRIGYLDRAVETLDDALTALEEAKSKGESLSVGLLGNSAEVYPEILRRGLVPDVLTDQTSAHDPVRGYLPAGWTLEQWRATQEEDPDRVVRAARESMALQVGTMLEFKDAGAIVMEYGNNLRSEAKEGGQSRAFEIPGFVQAYVRPLFCEGKGPFRWVALSGDPEDIYRTDQKVRELLPDDAALHNWLNKVRDHIPFQGLPARICWIGLGDRHRVAIAFNDMVTRGELSAPVVIGRDHMDSGSVASPTRETEGMLDGSDAVSDWPILNAMLNASCGATWVSFHHGGGVGLGFSQHAGIALVADGTAAAGEALGRVFWNDPATGVMRHADAGYEFARETARKHGLLLPMEA